MALAPAWLRSVALRFAPLALAALGAGALAGGFLLRGGAGERCDAKDHAACGLPAGEAAKDDGAPAGPLPDGPVVLEFSSEYCPACRRLEPILADARRQCARAGAPLVQIDVESAAGGPLATSMDVRATPTLVFLDAQHDEVGRLVGAQPLADVRRVLERAYGIECAALPRLVPGPG